ncbi:hypothetical protein HK101_008252 [Irineochytrium annulatum]|nr:hypothetical protein HK101_008252 [Irineochytrium annulatum]
MITVTNEVLVAVESVIGSNVLDVMALMAWLQTKKCKFDGEQELMNDAADPQTDPPPLRMLLPVELSIYGVGLLLNGILLCSYIKNRKNLLVQVIDYLFLIVICFQLSWAIFFVWFAVSFMSLSPQHLGQSYLCPIVGVATIAIVFNAITIHMVIAVERWLVVVAGSRKTWPLFGIAAFAESLITVTSWVQMQTTRKFEVSGTGTLCAAPCIAINRNYSELSVTIVLTSYCAVATGIILYAYVHIYKRLLTVTRALDRPSGNRESGNDLVDTEYSGTPAINREKHQVFYRCVGLVNVFLSTYAIELVAYVYKLASDQVMPAWVEALGEVLTTADVVATPIMIMFTNSKVLVAVESVVGMRLPPWKHGPGNNGRIHPSTKRTRALADEDDT